MKHEKEEKMRKKMVKELPESLNLSFGSVTSIGLLEKFVDAIDG